MAWTAAITIYTEDVRMDLAPEYRRSAGTIMNVSNPTRKGGYGPDTSYGLIDVTGIPDTVALERLRNFLLEPILNPVSPATLPVVEWRNCQVIHADLVTALKRDLTSTAKKRRCTMTWADFLAATFIKGRDGGRKLQDADVPKVGDGR